MLRIVLLLLSALAMLLASRRFYLSEEIGYDVGALFLLLSGIQLLIAAVVFHEQHESRTPKPPASAQDQEDTEDGPSGTQSPDLDSSKNSESCADRRM
jgi:CBS-domain-containing membrane protein